MIQISAYGRLTRDAKQITTKNNKDMATASLACDATPFGSEEQQTIFYSLTAFNYQAKDLAKHQKGDLIAVMGKVTLNNWTDKEGNKHEGHQILIDSITSSKTVRPTGGRKKQTQPSTQQQYKAQEQFYEQGMPKDCIPF